MKINLNVDFGKLAAVTVEKLLVVRFEIRSGRFNEMSAQLAVLFLNRYLVPAQASDSGGFHTGDAAADNHYPFYFVRWLDTVFPFSTAGGIYGTR